MLSVFLRFIFLIVGIATSSVSAAEAAQVRCNLSIPGDGSCTFAARPRWERCAK